MTINYTTVKLLISSMWLLFDVDALTTS